MDIDELKRYETLYRRKRARMRGVEPLYPAHRPAGAYRPRSRAVLKDVLLFERRHDVLLPDEYRTFLLDIGDGVPRRLLRDAVHHRSTRYFSGAVCG